MNVVNNIAGISATLLAARGLYEVGMNAGAALAWVANKTKVTDAVSGIIARTPLPNVMPSVVTTVMSKTPRAAVFLTAAALIKGAQQWYFKKRTLPTEESGDKSAAIRVLHFLLAPSLSKGVEIATSFFGGDDKKKMDKGDDKKKVNKDKGPQETDIKSNTTTNTTTKTNT